MMDGEIGTKAAVYAGAAGRRSVAEAMSRLFFSRSMPELERMMLAAAGRTFSISAPYRAKGFRGGHDDAGGHSAGLRSML